MTTSLYQPSPQKEPAKADLRGGMSIHDCAVAHNISEKTVRRYLKEVQAENGGTKQVPNAPGGRTQTEGGQVATITTPKPAAVVFTLGNQNILINPADLLESFMLYEDLKVKCQLEDSFSEVLKDGVGLLWEVLVNPPEGRAEENTMEENDGRSTEDGKEESGT